MFWDQTTAAQASCQVSILNIHEKTLRIAYVCHWNPFVEDGVVRKIRSQVRVWRESGADVQVFCLSAGYASQCPRLPGEQFLFHHPYVGRFVATMRLVQAAMRWQPDLVYLRYTPLLPPPVWLLRAIPTVIEINSDDRAEYRRKSLIQALFNQASRQTLFRAASGFACVTPELAKHLTPANRRARMVSISNGISLREGELLAPAGNRRLRLVFLAATSERWHGADKILSLASAIPEFDFDLVGNHEPADASLPSNVRLHGFCDPETYETILASADVALGTLALHRKGMSQAAPLKVREYLLRGIPTIIGYDDPDLRDLPWFVLTLPNTESNVRDSIPEIREFVSSVAGRRIPRIEVAHRIDIVLKERERLAFLSEVAAAK